MTSFSPPRHPVRHEKRLIFIIWILTKDRRISVGGETEELILETAAAPSYDSHTIDPSDDE